MNLTVEAIVEFRQIYAEECGELLTLEVAEQKASEMLELVRLLTRPHRESQGS